jgi:predicted GIY-YIG superfamily endonuclease
MIFYIVRMGEDIAGFGVTGNQQARFAHHKAHFKLYKKTFAVIAVYEIGTKAEAVAVERYVQRVLRDRLVRTGIDGFNREATHINNAKLISSTVKKAIRRNSIQRRSVAHRKPKMRK